jgi:uncharacterized protein HemX
MDAFLAFMIGTKLGRTISAALLISIGVGIAWWMFSDHYYDKGYDACQAGYKKLQDEANQRQAALNSQSNTTSSQVAKAASGAADKHVAAVDKSVSETKEATHAIYRDPPKTAPVALGSCVHPVDRRVQSRLEAARSAANGAAGNP